MQSRKITNLTKSVKSKSNIKIIGGKYRGKVLHMDILPHTRPTKAIVRESLFNTLQDFIVNKVFLEVFSGYGSVGFEAFSRGAKRVLFIEKDKQTFNILQQNISLFMREKNPDCNIDSRNKSSQNENFKNPKFQNLIAYHEDSLQFLAKLLLREKIDILYFDPPFGENGEYYYACFDILADSTNPSKNAIKGNIMVIFEHISSFAMPDKIANLALQKTRKFGKTSISYYG